MATIYWCETMAGGMAMPGGWRLAMLWMPVPGRSWASAAAPFLATWVVMMVAMMLPPLVPLLGQLGRNELAALAGAGYFAVWALFGAGVYVVGTAVAGLALGSAAVAGRVPLATGAALVAAGTLQLTPWKARQLARCRACAVPAAPDAASALAVGIRCGVNCSACCLGLMTALVVTGMMQVAVVAAVAAAIALERLAPRPALIARAIGALLVGGGVLVLARALGRGA